ncbi:MAG: efflux transporter outer membrane subunit [Rhodoferax sp.]|uniref:efflux transporter outer membrane subunit n=1 Tax=Rhodoferax sp. TaxID=50421 RepID=UPI0030162560
MNFKKPNASFFRPNSPPALVLVVALALGGCAAKPPANPLAADTASTATASENALALWWQKFNDPLLSQLVTQSLQANTSIRSAQAALQQSRALRDVKGASLLPGLNASGSAGRSKSGDFDASNSFKVGLDASWEPDIFGGQRSALNATEADAQASEASLADVQVSVAAEVAIAYIQLRGQQAQLQIARSNLVSQQETLQITKWRAQAGLITSLEVEQARTASEQTSAQVPALEASIAKTQHSLAVLTGQRPDALRVMLKTTQPVPQAAGSLAQSIPAQTLRQRPDVRAAEHRITAALARVSAADAARYPGFSISGSLGLNALTLGAITNGATVVSSLLAGISVPLFDGGAAKSQVLAQEAVLEQARASYQTVVLTALKDVDDALAALKGDQARQVHLQAAAEAAGHAALLAQNRYSSGLIDFQTVLLTQRSLLNAQDTVASTSADLSADHVRLYKALGGGWN